MKYLIAATLSALFMTTLPAQAEDGSERLLPTAIFARWSNPR